MKAAYLVTETDEAANLLKQMLPKGLLQDIEIVSAEEKYAALSVTGTIMSERSRPVLLVVDADSDNAIDAKEREQTLMGYLLPASTREPYQVCVAAPSIAAIAQTLAQNPTAEQIHDLQQHPLVQRIIQFLSNSFSQAA
jgi:DNA-binding LytR/AlgR family response regulator